MKISTILALVMYISRVNANVVFNNPQWNGIKLDWCYQWSTSCGKPAADYFCRLNNYNDSSSFSGPIHLNKTSSSSSSSSSTYFSSSSSTSTPVIVQQSSSSCPDMTVLPLTRQTCSPLVYSCDTFSSITCISPTVFNYPRFNGVLLDWCKNFGNNCGAPAAQWYCNYRNFTTLVSYKQYHITSGETIVPTSGAVCNPAYHGCDSFLYISCQ